MFEHAAMRASHAPGRREPRPTAPSPAKIAASVAACAVLLLLLAAAGCAERAWALDGRSLHVSYQWYGGDERVTEDYESFDAPWQADGRTMTAEVVEGAWPLGQGCSWRVMRNFAGGAPSGEEDVTSQAAFDAASGTVSVPSSLAAEDLTVVFTFPWDHASHDARGHFHGTSRPLAWNSLLTAMSAPRLAAAGSGGFTAGTVYPLSISSGRNGLESNPIVYGSDSNVTGAGTVMGYPEFNGRYKFYVAFSIANCELFAQVGGVPGRQGNGGTIYGGSGTPYDYGWAADHAWCAADCVENVYNTAGMPVPLNGGGSWVRIDDVSGNTMSCTFRIECNNPDGTNAQDIMGTFALEMPNGAIALQKESSNGEITQGNACYGLGGAVYGVFESADDARQRDASRALATYATDEAGAWESGDDFAAGTYFVAELEPPRGYALNEEVLRVIVNAGEVARVTAADAPLTGPASIRVQKLDRASGRAGGQGDGTLEGAEITFRYYDGHYTAETLPSTPTRTWVMRTTAEGVASPLHGAGAMVSGSALFQDAAGQTVIPLGTLTALETKAPDGYLLGSPSLRIIDISEDPTTHEAVATALPGADAGTTEDGMPVIGEDPIRGNVAIVKRDAQTGQRTPQGDASLAGARYDVVNRSAASVVSPQTGQDVAPGGVVCTIVTDATGYASTDNAQANGWSVPGAFDGGALAYGAYEVVEAAPGSGYLVNGSFSATVEIRRNNQRLAVETDDAVARGGLVVGKTSRENGAYLEQGAASLAGWAFEVVNASAYAVVVDGARCEPGDVVATIVTEEADGRFVAGTGPTALPFGTYEVREAQTMRPQDCGYLFDGASQAWSKTVTIRTDGQIADLTGPEGACGNQVARGDLEFSKAKSPGMGRLAGIPFKVTSVTTGEWHVIVTDRNGHASTSSASGSHASGTNANDAAIGPDGAVDEALLDDEAGVWFDGRADARTVPDDGKGALPFDTYEIEELRVSANEGLDLVKVEATVYRDGETVDFGTIVDTAGVAPRIGTSLADANGNKVVAPEAGALLVDTVSYNNLDTSEAYSLAGELYLVEDGQATELVAEARRSFTPGMAHGSIDMLFELDASGLQGRSLVCFERLYDAGGSEIASHADADDGGQTVSVPSIGTTLLDAATQGHAASASDGGTFELTDTVAFTGLAPYKAYTLTGTLHDGLTGEVLTDSRGLPVTATRSFVPREGEGSVDVAFSFTLDVASDASIVAFESLSCRGVEYAVHADLADEGQTVTVDAPPDEPAPPDEEPPAEPKEEPPAVLEEEPPAAPDKEPPAPPENRPQDEPKPEKAEIAVTRAEPGPEPEQPPAKGAPATLAKTGDAPFGIALVLVPAGALGLALAALSVRRLERDKQIVIERGRPKW